MEKMPVACILFLSALVLAGCIGNGRVAMPPDDIPKYGTLVGTLSIGPLCPVEPCQNQANSSAIYGARKVVAYDAATKRRVEYAMLNQTHGYSMELPPGKYIIDVTDADGKELGLDSAKRPALGSAQPQEVEITDRNTTVLDFDIDTGIR